MSQPAEAEEGPFVGSRCLAGPDGFWDAATIRRVNDDGTFNVEFDVKDLQILPLWYGVTLQEISFSDAAVWPAVFAELCPSGVLRRVEFPAVLMRLGFKLAEGFGPAESWNAVCASTLGIDAERARDIELGVDSAYEFFRAQRLSAKEYARRLESGSASGWLKLYWNQIRMGGRDPAELRHTITLDDTFAALGLGDERVDQSVATFLSSVERAQPLSLPAELTTLLSRVGAVRAIDGCHPNSPRLVPLRANEWIIERGVRERGVDGDFAVRVFAHYDLDGRYAVFSDGDTSARVYFDSADDRDSPWFAVAPTLALFFWDLAQTGKAWSQSTTTTEGSHGRRGAADAEFDGPGDDLRKLFESVGVFLKSLLRFFWKRT